MAIEEESKVLVRKEVACLFGPGGGLDIGIDGLCGAMAIVRDSLNLMTQPMGDPVEVAQKALEAERLIDRNRSIGSTQLMTLVTDYRLHLAQWNRILIGVR